MTEEKSRRAQIRSENVTTPVTPTARLVSSPSYSTPGSSFGKEEDAVVIEISPRFLRAGIEGETGPQCYIPFTPQASRRHGDYRLYLPGYVRAKESLETWGEEYELWRNDLKGVNLGLVADKLERVVREVFNKYLLVDAGNARLVLVLPSIVPHPVLETILQTFFERWPCPSISLLPVTATALVAAGLRSGLIVDIGWEETIVTSMYELREVRVVRSTRAMKTLTKEFARVVRKILSSDHRYDLEMIEEVIQRIGSKIIAGTRSNTKQEDEPIIKIDWPTDAFTREVQLSVAGFQSVFDNVFFSVGDDNRPDDHETPIHTLLYDALRALPTDIRAICIARVVFTGQGAEIDGLGSFILSKLQKLLDQRGWDVVDRTNSRKSRSSAVLTQTQARTSDHRYSDDTLSHQNIIEERYIKDKLKHYQPPVQGMIREVDSMGSWVGASLLTSLKVKSAVEIQRDRFLSHGLAGATRNADVSVVAQKRMSMLGVRNKPTERTSWTLSGWG